MSPVSLRDPLGRLPLSGLRSLAALRAQRAVVAAARCAQARERLDYEEDRMRRARDSIASTSASLQSVESNLRQALRAADGLPAGRAVAAQLAAGRLREDLRTRIARLQVIEADAAKAEASANAAGSALLRETVRSDALAALCRRGVRDRVGRLDLRRADDASAASARWSA